MSQWTDSEICRRCGSGIEHHDLVNGKSICPGTPEPKEEEN